MIVIRHLYSKKDCDYIIDCMYEDKICFVSVEDVDIDMATRILDNLEGAARAIGGSKIEKISEEVEIYIITPPDMEIETPRFRQNRREF